MKIAQSLAIVTTTVLAGCSGTGLGGAGDALDTKPISAQTSGQQKPNTTAGVTPPAPINSPKQGQATTASANAGKAGQAGQQELPGQQYMSNGVVRSLRELTAEQPDTPYPVIADAPPQKRRLLTPEERAKLEQELRDLSK